MPVGLFWLVDSGKNDFNFTSFFLKSEKADEEKKDVESVNFTLPSAVQSYNLGEMLTVTFKGKVRQALLVRSSTGSHQIIDSNRQRKLFVRMSLGKGVTRDTWLSMNQVVTPKP